MKIEFLTEDDFYVLPLFEEFFRRHASRFDIVRVSCCRTMGNRPRGELLRHLLCLYGFTGFMRLLGRYGAARLLSRLPRGPNAPGYYSIEQLCGAYGVPYERIGNPNAEDFRQAVSDRRAEVLISVACPYILKRALLEMPPLGCINLHNAPLPRYKGMMPTFWQVFHGETALGLTIHYMTEEIDDGQILFQDWMEVRQDDTLDQLIRRSKRRAAQCLAQVLDRLETGTIQPVPLSKENSSYFTFPNRDEIREFRRRGLRAI
jgi:methionyl-tRNA formyltransferase